MITVSHVAPSATFLLILTVSHACTTKDKKYPKQRAGKTYLKPYEGLDEAWNMNCLWFQYKDIDKFNNCQDIQEQREMLCNYVKEVFEYVANS